MYYLKILILCILLFVHVIACRGNNNMVNRKDPVVLNPVISTTEPLYAGAEATFTCKSGGVGTTIKWLHVNQNNQNITNLSAVTATTTRYIIQLEEFDNDTTLHCIAQTRDGAKKNTSYHIITNIPADNIANDHVKVVYYYDDPNNQTKVNVHYNCISEQDAKYIKIIVIQYNIITRQISKVKKVEDYFSKNDSGSFMACVHYNKYGTNVAISLQRRIVNDIVKLVYVKDSSSVAKSENGNYGNDESPSDLKIIIGTATVGAIFILITVLFLVIRSCNKNTETAIPKENTSYTNPALVYADLDLGSLARNDRVPVVNESPYAQIINLDTVLYSELNLSQNNQTLPTEESQYAQIMQPYRK